MLLAKDGTVLVYGDGDDPQRLCYRFRRFVDTGTAACLLIRRATFDALGGFDERYAPAYYEDVDLCMRLAKPGCGSSTSRVPWSPTSATGRAARPTLPSSLSATAPRSSNAGAPSSLGRPGRFRRPTPQAAIAARDAMATPRVLICAPIEHPAAGAVASAFMAGWPSARVTWATASSTGAHQRRLGSRPLASHRRRDRLRARADVA